ncbi:Fic family protein [Demequina capsici]|uniref:Fic family protein n=1 Tax=Demequina capsici TaxID=3075620 RepID=A0AA96F4D5_9MICO|nr:Fic family protein [Demequina sp. OYTSA14]WNM23514.1 Fic family protein [Demequina sp. OYTSA14]
MSVRALPGTRIGNLATGKITYSPPEGRAVIESKLSDWERFIHADDGLDPLVRMAAAHYQFEAIHPFTDGNGRTGRILNVLVLVEAGLLKLPVLYLSRHIIATKSEYYARLLAVTAESAWEPWLLYVLRGVETTSKQTLQKIAAITDLQEEFAHAARAHMRSVDVELLAVVFEQPYCRISTVQERYGVSRPTATAWLRSLVEAGLLEEVTAGRERLFINRRLLTLLTALAEARGLVVWPNVTKRVRAVVAQDPASQSGKPRKAREYGIPVVDDAVLALSVSRTPQPHDAPVTLHTCQI